MKNRLRILYILWIGIVLGILSTLLFFPFPFNRQFTCLFHRTFMGAHQIHSEHLMVPYYITHFGYFWWGSLFFTAFVVYSLLKNLKKRKDD